MTVDAREFIGILVQRGFHPSEFLQPEGPHALGAQMTDVAGWIKVTMASGFSYNVLGLDEVGVNELVKDIFRNKVTALTRVPIDPILWQGIREYSAKYVVQHPHYVLSAKTETPASSAPVPLGSSQAELASAYTVALASVFGVKQRPTLPMDLQFSVREPASESVSDKDIGQFLKPAVPAARHPLQEAVETFSTLADESEELDGDAQPSPESSTAAQSSKGSSGKCGARSQRKRHNALSRLKRTGVQKKRMRQPLLEESHLREDKGEEKDGQKTREEEDLQYEPSIRKSSAAVAANLVTRQQLTFSGEPPLPALVGGAGKRKSKSAQRRHVLAADIQEAAEMSQQAGTSTPSTSKSTGTSASTTSKPAATSASTTSQSTATQAPTPTALLFDLPPRTLSSFTSTSEGADRANAEKDIESAADASAAAETVPGDDQNQQEEPDAADDDELKFTGLDEATDRRWIKPPHAMTISAVKDLSMFVRAQTTAMKHRPSWIFPNLKLSTSELELHQYSVKLMQRLSKDDRKALRFIAALTPQAALVRFAPELFKTVGRRWPSKKERSSWNVIQWSPAELIQSRRILK